MPVEEEVGIEDGWDVLDIVVYLSDVQHRLELQVQVHRGNRRRKLTLLWFGLASGRADGLTRCLSLVVGCAFSWCRGLWLGCGLLGGLLLHRYADICTCLLELLLDLIVLLLDRSEAPEQH